MAGRAGFHHWPTDAFQAKLQVKGRVCGRAFDGGSAFGDEPAGKADRPLDYSAKESPTSAGLGGALPRAWAFRGLDYRLSLDNNVALNGGGARCE